MLARESRASTPTWSCPIPDSGVCAAIGFAEESGVPMRMGLIRNHYVGRTFIQPQQAIRHFGVRVKLNPVRSILEGKRVVLVDDSIVRGTTSRKIVKMVRAAGAKEVHMRISCPPTISPCFYGVDTPRASELIAATHTLEEIREYLERRHARLSQPRGPAGRRRHRQRTSYCTSCYTGVVSGGVPARRAGLPAARAQAWTRSKPSLSRSLSVAAARAAVGSAVVCVRRRRPPPARPDSAGRQATSPRQLQAAIDKLGEFDTALAIRRARRAPRAGRAGGPGAARGGRRAHADGYVRFRALVLLSGFNDPRARDVMRAGARRSRTIGCATSPTPISSTTRIRRCRRALLEALERRTPSSSGRR